MSVIIRLQNLPWSANALDIRQFFRGLSIPEGGVHIVGGEMGDAFIAFSTDEDARQAMMHDREAINGVQIRLLLSSRAEMQKVIETARQHSILALKKASGVVLAQPKVSPSASVAMNVKRTAASSAPQPPVITANSFQSILSNSTAKVTPSFLAYQQQAGFTLIPESSSKKSVSPTKNSNDSDDSESCHSQERHRSDSKEIRRSRDRNIFKRRLERSRERSRDRDWVNGRRSSRRRSRSREKSRARSRERSREEERSRSGKRDSDRRNTREAITSSRNRNIGVESKSNILPWNSTNSYKTSYTAAETSQVLEPKLSSVESVAVTAISSTLQNYNSGTQSLTALNNYSLSGIIGAGSNTSFKGFALQNPYTSAQNSSSNSQENDSNITSSSAIPGIFVEKKCDDATANDIKMDVENNLPQGPIAFANVNPYEKMYPKLFAQAAALNSGQKSNVKQGSLSMPTNSPKADDTESKEIDPNETNCVKISNMCSRTTYSDLRKFFVGLFIPHNGIKMLNDKHGLRVGVAYVQFSRQSSVTKALCRSNNLLKGRSVMIDPVTEQEFIDAEDSFRPVIHDKAYSHRSNDSDNENSESGVHSNNKSGYSALNPYKKVIQPEPFTVLYIEDIPALGTEQDIMKMFSSYSLYDILLIASPENRREFVAYVHFSREEDAKSAYEDRAHHQIGYRRVRVRPGSLKEMENAKEKIRLANEQLLKEEKAAEEEETKRKLEKLITDHITQEENRQQNVISLDLTEEADDSGVDENNIGETTNDLQDIKKEDVGKDVAKNQFNNTDVSENRNNFDMRNNDSCSTQNQLNKSSNNLDSRQLHAPNIPSLFDFDPLITASLRNQNRSNLFNDPRLRNISERVTPSTTNSVENNNFNKLGSHLNNQKEINPTNTINNTEKNFVILKNCDYKARINDVAQLLLTANLALKHIEPLCNERQLSTGEFIVEFRGPTDAKIATERFHNIPFRKRTLKVIPITPQEIADRLGKPFLSYIPGGNGIRLTKSLAMDAIALANFNISNNLMANTNNNNNMRFGNTSQNMNFNNFRGNNPFNDMVPLNNNNSNSSSRTNLINNNSNCNKNSGGNGIPEKFTFPGCVLSLENVPYKAQISDILRFFQGFNLMPDDIIRRYNDDGSPTGDARVAFISPDEARSAFELKRRKQLFGRNIFIKII